MTNLANISPRVAAAPTSAGRRIAIAIPGLLPLAGAERLVVMQATCLLNFGYNVDFVFASEPQDVRGWIPAEARAIKLGVTRFRDVVRPFARYLLVERPDAVHAVMWPFTSLSIVAHRLARSPARIIVSDHNMLSIQYGTRGLAHRVALRASLAATYPFAHARVAVSDGVANDIAALSGITRARFTVIHNAMSLPMPANGDRAPAEAAWGGWTGQRIITVGLLKAQKNHALLVRAFKRLLETTDARLMILGTGELEEVTRAIIGAESLAGKVLMPGHVADPVPFYHSADLFVLSSDYEGFGNVIIEALACGVPVVSTDCRSGPAEILENGRWGRLVPVNDVSALADAMAEALVAEHDREALKRRAMDFSPMRATEKYLDLLFNVGAAMNGARL